MIIKLLSLLIFSEDINRSEKKHKRIDSVKSFGRQFPVDTHIHPLRYTRYIIELTPIFSTNTESQLFVEEKSKLQLYMNMELWLCSFIVFSDVRGFHSKQVFGCPKVANLLFCMLKF